MIRKFTITSLLFSVAAMAQVTPTLLNDLSDGNTYYGFTDLAVHNNTAYISNSDAGMIFKVSLSTPNATPEMVVSNVSFPTGLAVSGSNLYYFEGADAVFSADSGKLWRLDLSNPAAAPVNVMSNLSFPTEIEISGNMIYAAENVLVDGDLDHGQVTLINLSGTPTKTVLYDQLYSLDDMEIDGNNLYLLEWDDVTDQTTILKLDVSTGLPATPTMFYEDPAGYYPLRIEIANGKLFFNMDSGVSPHILMLDLNSGAPVAEEAVGPFEFNGQGVYLEEMVVTADNNLYAFGSTFDGTDSNYLLYTANVSSLGAKRHSASALGVYPNPCTSEINLKGIAQSAFSVYDLTGKQLLSGTTDGAINVSALQNGVYVLNVDGFQAVKFVKQ